MYYLNSRYYDQEIARFINADIIDLVLASQTTLTDKNLYAYCDNNPVVRKDAGGAFWDTVLDVISLGASITEIINDPKDSGAWIGLIADIACLALPFATGGGALVKAVSKSDDIIDCAKVADNLDEIGKIVIEYGDEVKLPNQIKLDNVVEVWDDFLGPNQTDYNKFTGLNDIDRIFSADGTKSIRFGAHEMRSIGTSKAHFHYETWKYDSVRNTVSVTNTLQRLR